MAGGISEALVATAIGLFVAIPAVWMFNYFNTRLKSFDVEMENSSSELIDYFLKRSQKGAANARDVSGGKNSGEPNPRGGRARLIDPLPGSATRSGVISDPM